VFRDDWISAHRFWKWRGSAPQGRPRTNASGMAWIHHEALQTERIYCLKILAELAGPWQNATVEIRRHGKLPRLG